MQFRCRSDETHFERGRHQVTLALAYVEKPQAGRFANPPCGSASGTFHHDDKRKRRFSPHRRQFHLFTDLNIGGDLLRTAQAFISGSRPWMKKPLFFAEIHYS